MSSRRVNSLVLVILLLAFALRLIALNSRPIWYDEAFSIFLAEQDLASIVRGTAADVQPPLYYMLLHFWQALGENVFALRFLSVALSLIVVALMYALAQRLISSVAGVFAMLFTALAPFQIYHAQELRMYSLLPVGLLLYGYGSSRLICARRFRAMDRTLTIIGAIVALYAHSLAIFTLVVVNMYLLFKRAWRKQLQLIVAQAIASVVFVPWLMALPVQVENIQRAYWTLPPGIVDLIQMLVGFTAYLPLPLKLIALALFVTLVVFAIVLLELARLFRRGALGAFGLLMTFVLVPPALLFILSYMMRPVFVPRGVIASSLAYYIILAGLAARAPRAGQIAIVALAGTIALGTLPFFYSAWGEWRRAPFAEADQFLRVRIQPADLILHDNKLAYFPMRFYDRTLPQEFLADPLGSSNDTLAPASQEALGLVPVNLDAAIRDHPRVWFVIFQTAIDQATEEGHPHGNLSQLDAAMRRSDVASFADLRVFLYETR